VPGAAPQQHTAKLIVRCGDVGISSDGEAQLMFGLLKLIKPSQYLARMIVRSRMARRQRERPFQRLARSSCRLSRCNTRPSATSAPIELGSAPVSGAGSVLPAHIA